MLGGTHNFLTACAMPPSSQIVIYIYILLESLWCSFLARAMCDIVGGMICHQRCFFSLSSPINYYGGLSKSQSCSLIYMDFNLSSYSFDF